MEMKVCYCSARTLLVLVCLVTATTPARWRREGDASLDCPAKTKTLYLIVMAPLPDSTPGLEPGWAGGPAIIPGSQLAVRHINSRCDILEDYRLELLIADSGCNVREKTVVGFFENLLHVNHTVVAIVGPGCSGATITVGNLLARRGISLLHIAPSATSPLLVDPGKYPNTFRILGSNNIYISMYDELIKYMNFKNIAILFNPERIIHTSVARKFEEKLLANNSHINVLSLNLARFFIPLVEMQNRYRIIFVFAGSSISRKLMCLAYHMDILYPDYQFIFSERRLDHFLEDVSFNLDGKRYTCSASVMRVATRGIMLSQFELIREDEDTILVNDMNYRQFAEEYSIELERYKQQLNLSSIVQTEHQSGYYDSVWAFTLAMNASIPRLKNELNTSLENYGYGQPNATNIIRSELLKLEFEGIRGTIKFSESTLDGKDATTVRISQVKDTGQPNELVATYNPARNVALNLINRSAFLPDTFSPELVAPPLYVEGIVYVIVVMLTASTLAFQIINIKWGKVQSIKVTSPALNHLIFIGCYFYLPSILFLSFDEVLGDRYPEVSSFKCIGYIWCESIALTLILGTICVKSFRILRIFSHSSARMMNNLQTYRLVLYVGAMLIPDFVLNIVWNVVDPYYLETVIIDERHIRVACTCNYIIVWIILLFALKILLITVVLYLSIATRRIQKQEYKQTKSTNILVFILVMVYGILIPVHYLTASITTNVGTATLSYLVLSLKNILCVLMCTIFIFLPPILPILVKKGKAYRLVS